MTTALKNKAPKTGRTRRTAVAGAIEMSSPKAADKGTGKGKTTVLHFGSATLRASTSHRDWERYIGLGQAALKKMKLELLKPGVRLRTSKSTPLFRADPENPSQLIRVLDGKEDRGIFEGGVFKILP